MILVRPSLRAPHSPIGNIQNAVAAYYELPPLHMVSAQRGHMIAHPRQIAMYLASELTTKSLVEIGKRFGGRDHSTVLHAIKQVKKRIANDPSIAADVAALRKALAG